MSDDPKSENDGAPLGDTTSGAEDSTGIVDQASAQEDTANEAGGDDYGMGDDMGENDVEDDGMGLPDDAFDEDDEDGENKLLTAVVPRLDDLIVKSLAESYDIYPALDRIPPEYLDNVVALLDPSQIEFSVAAKYINVEKFWKRLCQERWPICQIANHGLSWKRLYIERHLQALFEAYYPSNQGQNYDRLLKEVNAGKPYVHTVTILQLLSHLDLADMLVDFPNLSTLTLTYGARKLGMDYDKSLFGMQLKDAMHLARCVSKTRTLSKLTLSENLLNDESIHILSSGLAKNDTLTYLDLSHNKISDTGAKRIARLLRKGSVLVHLDLGDNRVHETGGRALGNALAQNSVLTYLSLKLNPLGDVGGMSLLGNIVNNPNCGLSYLDVSGQNLSPTVAKTLCQLVSENTSLTELDVSSNDIPIGPELVTALKKNKTLTRLDLRRNPVEEEEHVMEIKALLAKRYAQAKRANRRAFQDGWDDDL